MTGSPLRRAWQDLKRRLTGPKPVELLPPAPDRELSDDALRNAVLAGVSDRIQGFSSRLPSNKWGAPHWILDTFLPSGQQELWRGDDVKEMQARCEMERARLMIKAAISIDAIASPPDRNAVIEGMRTALEDAEQAIELHVNGASSIDIFLHTLKHIQSALKTNPGNAA